MMNKRICLIKEIGGIRDSLIGMKGKLNINVIKRMRILKEIIKAEKKISAITM
jgi:hypothetical protein